MNRVACCKRDPCKYLKVDFFTVKHVTRLVKRVRNWDENLKTRSRRAISTSVLGSGLPIPIPKQQV